MNKVLINIVGSLSYAFIQWFIIAYISREVSVEAAGLYALYLAFFSPLAILCAFGLRNQIATDVNNNFSSESYKKVLILGNLFFLLSSMIIVYNYNYDVILLVIFLIKWLEINAEKIYGEWINNGKAELYGLSRIYKSLFTVLVFITLHLMNVDDELIIISYPITYFLVFFMHDLRNRSKVSENEEQPISSTKSLFLFSLPVIFSAFIVSLCVSIPKIVLSKFASIDFVATYTLLIYFGSVAIIPLMSAFPVYMADFARSKTSSDVKRFSVFVIIYALVFLISMLLFSDYIMRYVYQIDNYNYINIVLSALIGVTQIILVWLSFLLTTMRRFKYLFKSNLLNLITVSVLSLALGRYYQMEGVLMSVFISNTFLVVFNSMYVLASTKKKET